MDGDDPTDEREYVEPGRTVCVPNGHELPMGTSEPCPECGSTKRAHGANAGHAAASASANGAGSRAKEWDPAYREGKRSRSRPARQRTVSVSPTHADGIERTRRVEIGKVADTYEETVFDPDGSVYYHFAEPLSEHQGHGSAKAPRDDT